MHVLFVSNSPHLPQVIGGAQWSVHYFAQGLRQRGHTVSVLSALQDGGWLALRNKVLRKLGGGACPVDRAMGYPVARGWDVARGLAEAVEAARPDVVLFSGIGSAPVPLAKDALARGLPVLYLAMDVGFERHGGALSELRGAGFVANSLFTAARLRERFGIVASVVRPPVDPARCRVPPGGGKVVMVNPQASKGGLVALALAEARPDIPFVFYEAWAGDLGPIRARAAGLANIEWRRGVLDHREIYREARLVLMPSQAEEAWGMVASEAQCSGIPVIGSDIGGLSEAIGPGGIRVPATAPTAAWLDALGRAWDDPAEWARLSAAAADHARRPEIQCDHQVARLDACIGALVAGAAAVPAA